MTTADGRDVDVWLAPFGAVRELTDARAAAEGLRVETPSRSALRCKSELTRPT